ncbi:MAG: GNAT family N-acetyltransferase [Bacteroidota bacterium]
MKIESVDKNSGVYSKLQAFIEKHGLVFNGAAWVNNYPERQITQCAILNNNNDVIGCFFYFSFKKSVFKFIITPPFSPDIGLFYVNPSESVVGKNSFNKEVVQQLAQYFDDLNVHYININLPKEVTDTQPFTWNKFLSRNRYSYLLALKGTEEDLWNNLASEKRKSINKAIKDGLVITETSDPELAYSLIIQSLSRNFIAKNLSIIKNILASLAAKTNTFSFVAYQDKLPVGATFCVVTKSKAVYIFGGFNFENKHHGAGVSCMWQSILKAKALGLEYFDFEGSMNPAIERYFREFGGELTPYFNVQKISPFLNILLKIKRHNPL